MIHPSAPMGLELQIGQCGSAEGAWPSLGNGESGNWDWLPGSTGVLVKPERTDKKEVQKKMKLMPK